jgi:hypothetical protein
VAFQFADREPSPDHIKTFIDSLKSIALDVENLKPDDIHSKLGDFHHSSNRRDGVHVPEVIHTFRAEFMLA